MYILKMAWNNDWLSLDCDLQRRWVSSRLWPNATIIDYLCLSSSRRYRTVRNLFVEGELSGAAEELVPHRPENSVA